MNKKLFLLLILTLILFFVFYPFFVDNYLNFKKNKSFDDSSFSLEKSYVLENKQFFPYAQSHSHLIKPYSRFLYCYNKTRVYNELFSDLFLFNVSYDNFDSVPCFSVYYRYLENEGYPLTVNLKKLYYNDVLFNNDSFPHFYSYVYVFKFDNFSYSRAFFDFLSFVFNSDSFNKHFSYHYFYKDINDIPIYSNIGSNYNDLFYYKSWFSRDNFSFYHHTLVVLYDDKVLVSKTFTNSSTVKYYVSTIT